MSIKVLFFASIREDLGPEILVSYSEGLTVASLRESLGTRGQAWGEALGQPNVFCAVNQSVVDFDYSLSDGDEVAFFPPMTGG